MFGLLAILWVLSPFVLIPLVISYRQKYNSAMIRILELEQGNSVPDKNKIHIEWQMNPDEKSEDAFVEKESIEFKESIETLDRVERLEAIQQQIVKGIDTTIKGKVVPEKQVDYREKRMQGSMVVGVLLILVSALIFATTTWQVMPQIMKVMLIASVSLVFYVASYFSRKKFDLEITSIAFYQLGCFFTPVAILCVGFFELLGTLFTLRGNGVYVVQLVMAIVFGISAYIGRRIFERVIFYYMTQAATCIAFFMLPSGLGYDLRVGVFFTLCYVFYLNTKLVLEGDHQWLHIIQPFVMWTCIGQGIYLFHVSALTQITVMGIFAILFYFLYYLIEGIRDSSFYNPVARILCLVMQSIAIWNAMMYESYWYSFIGSICLLVCLVCNAKKGVNGIERQLSIWGVLLPFYYVWQLFDIQSISNKSLIFTGITSVCFLLTLGIILCYKAYVDGHIEEDAEFPLLCNDYKLPMLLVTSGFAFYASGILPISKLAIIAVWQVVSLLYLLRDDIRYERALLLIGIVAPSLSVGILSPIPINDLMTGSVLAFTGIMYLALSAKYFLRNRTLTKWIGTITMYFGYWLVFLELPGRSFDYSSIGSTQTILYDIGIPYCIAYAIVIGAFLLSRVLDTSILVTPIQFTIIFLMYRTIETVIPLSVDQLYAVGIGLGILFILLGRYGKKSVISIYKEENKINIEGVDFIGISAIVGILPASFSTNEYLVFASCCAITFYAFSFYKRQNVFVDVIANGITLFLGFVSWCHQPFFEIPTDYLLEYGILGVVIVITILELIKGSRTYVDWIQYGLAVVCVLVQGMECLIRERIADVLFLGIAMVFVLLYSGWKQQMRWMVLSLITIIILLLYMTRSFWMSIAWWVYLLVAGITLVGVAIHSEVKKEK